MWSPTFECNLSKDTTPFSLAIESVYLDSYAEPRATVLFLLWRCRLDLHQNLVTKFTNVSSLLDALNKSIFRH